MKWYKYDIRDLTDEAYTYWYSLMSEKKQRRVDRFRFDDDKKRTVAGEMLARRAIAEWCSVTPESIVFDTKENGKPYVVNLNVEFNVSHSYDYTICAVSNKPIGVDIEKVRAVDLNVVERVCNEDELEYISNDNSKKRFFKIWTFKEAYFKYIGTGITDFKSIDYFNSDTDKLRIDYDDYIVHIVY